MVNKVLISVVVIFIHCYQNIISALLPFNYCRFYPSCSEYALEAVAKYGIIKGFWLSLKRIVKCRPYTNTGGIDIVP